jgi:small-conductance mechanosensitive channel
VRIRAVLVALVAILCGIPTAAQAPQPPPPPFTQAVGVPPNVQRAAASASLAYFNRPIIEFRATVFGRDPAERAAVATRVLDDLVDDRILSPVSASPVEGGSLISVGGRLVLGISQLDVDELAGETMTAVVSQTIARLEVALAEAAEARRASTFVRATTLSAVALILATVIIWGLGRLRRAAVARLAVLAETTMAKAGLGGRETLHRSKLLDFQRSLVLSISIGLKLLVVYAVSTFVLQLFPYTRPWGESLSGYLLRTLATLGLGIVYAIPGLFTVLIIVVLTRIVVRLAGLWFAAVERGRIAVSWMYPETARPTRRLITALIWLFAVIVAYPYLPGSNSDAFKGVSVFVGVIVSLGSSGLMNQIMSGFVVTFSRALRVGSYVRIGDIEGTVTHLGVLSTKVRTLMAEEVTIPHAVVVAQTATDYSRTGDAPSVLTPISVTIGYDAPWRQVHALLLRAAERTPGLRADPKPHVLQSALEDFYVRYTLYVALDRQQDRLIVIDELNRNIQDAFNEFGVQIMSPNYMLDPAAPKVVPKSHWFAAPAKPEPK